MRPQIWFIVNICDIIKQEVRKGSEADSNKQRLTNQILFIDTLITRVPRKMIWHLPQQNDFATLLAVFFRLPFAD